MARGVCKILTGKAEHQTERIRGEKTVRIAYCEDERAQAVLTEDMIKSWAKERGQKCIVDVFSSAEQFLFELDGEELVPYDLLLLDISMIGMDGFTLAKQIRKTDMNIRIVFLTSDPSHVFDGYEIEAWRYMMKPVREQKLHEMLDILVTELADREEPYVLLEVAGENIKVEQGQILYVAVDGHYTTVYCKDRQLTVKESFGEVLNHLNRDTKDGCIPPFVKCHRSTAVNLSKVSRIGRQSCVLAGEIEVPVSRGMYQQLNQAFIQENL